MSWTAYKIVLRLRSALHIGAGKVGNLQRARPYVAGRNLWGALTERLARDGDSGKPDPEEYQKMGDRVHEELAFTYLFPTTSRDGDVNLWPWDDGFRYQFLSTYAATALNYAAYSAEEASLHEVECLTPHTRDPDGDGEQVYLTGPVYLTGYVFQKKGPDLGWQTALRRLQIGGERGYGWGRVEVVAIAELDERTVPLFGTGHVAHLDGETVSIRLAKGQPILAHALAADFDEQHKAIGGAVAGRVEPLVGRETTPETKFGVRLSQARICYAPGARIEKAVEVRIGPYGVWEQCPEPVEGAP